MYQRLMSMRRLQVLKRLNTGYFSNIYKIAEQMFALEVETANVSTDTLTSH